MTISNRDAIIDLSDVVDRLDELEDVLAQAREEYNLKHDTQLDVSGYCDICADDEAVEEYNILSELAECGGDELIRETYFKEAMGDAIADSYDWLDLPFYMSVMIDYEALKTVYSAVDYHGVTYYIGWK